MNNYPYHSRASLHELMDIARSVVHYGKVTDEDWRHPDAVSPTPEFLRFGAEHGGHPVILAINIRSTVSGKTNLNKRYKKRSNKKGAVRAWDRLPYQDNGLRQCCTDLARSYGNSPNVQIVGAIAIWSTPMA